MNRIAALWRLVRAVPAIAWAVAAGAGLATGAWTWHTATVDHAVTAAVEADRLTRAVAAEQYVATVLQRERLEAAWKVAAATERADSAWVARDRAVRRTREVERELGKRLAAFDVAVTALPDSLRAVPQVTRVVGACTALAQDCAQLRAEITRERAATELAQAEAAAERAARVLRQAVADSALAHAGAQVAALVVRAEAAERRPTWRRVLTLGGGVLFAVAASTHVVRSIP